MVPNAGIPAYTKVAVATLASSSVGSSQISLPTMAYNNQYITVLWSDGRLTAEHETTKPNISMPASANAALAAIDPAETHPSIPSFSMIVRKISMLDFGRSSNRTEDSNA